MIALLDILPFDYSAIQGKTPALLMKSALEFFELWIGRVGGIIAFVGAIKLAMSLRNEDEEKIMTAAFTMVSGFMIMAAINNLDVFNIPNNYTKAAANTEFKSIVKFIEGWAKKVGAVGLFAGSVGFCFAIKDNNANGKVMALRGMTAGAIVISVAGIIHSFV